MKRLNYHNGVPLFVLEALRRIADPATGMMESRGIAEDTLRRLFVSVEDRNSQELERRCA